MLVSLASFPAASAQSVSSQDDPQSQYNLGVRYAEGDGVARDDVRAAMWYRRAAAQGYASAEYNLGFLHLQGRGVARSDVEAAQWFTRAAERGHAQAQGMLGHLYEQGRGVFKSPVIAARWYRRAAAQGVVHAAQRLDEIEPGWRQSAAGATVQSAATAPPRPSTPQGVSKSGLSRSAPGTAAAPASPNLMDLATASTRADHQGRLRINGDPVTLQAGGRDIVGIKIRTIDDESPLVLTGVQPGDTLGGLNGVVFDSGEALSRYVASLRIPFESFTIDYWSATEKKSKREGVLSIEPVPRLVELESMIVMDLAKSVPHAYSCSHLTAEEQREYLSRTRIYNERPATLSVKRAKIARDYLDYLNGINEKIGAHAKAHPCLRRNVDPAVQARVRKRVDFMRKCSALANLEILTARQVGSPGMLRWAKENEDKSVEVLTAAMRELNSAGIDGQAWLGQLRRESEEGRGFALHLMPDSAERQRIKRECIRQDLLIDIETRMKR